MEERTEFEEALSYVLKESFVRDGLARGLRETVHSLERKTAKLCVLAEDCDSAEYTKLIRALCKANGIPLVVFPEKKKLGELALLCKIDKQGTARKVVKCSSLAVNDYGEDSKYAKKLIDAANA